MGKNYTLIGMMNQVIESYREGNIPTTETLQATMDAYVKENVTKAYIESLSSESVAPTTLTISDVLYFFANGTPVTIQERTDGEAGALISWEDGEMLVGEQTNVFGGRHDDDTATNGDITMTGGTVRNVFGGGLHKSHTILATVKMSGGKTNSVCGGGVGALTKACGCSSHTFSGDALESPCVCDEARVFITGGEIGTLYGGGQGINYCKKVVLNVGGTAVAEYVTPGGSHGQTDEASTTITGDAVLKCVQGINRGLTKVVKTVVDGGNITGLFAGGEVPFIDSAAVDPTGKFESVKLTIMSGNVENLSLGSYDYKKIEAGDEILNSVKVVIEDEANIKNNYVVA